MNFPLFSKFIIKCIVGACCLLHPSFVRAFQSVSGKDVALIPQPSSLTLDEGVFDLNRKTRIVIGANLPGIERIASDLSGMLHISDSGLVPVVYGERTKKHDVILRLNASYDVGMGDEGYTLKVAPNGVEMNANTQAGLFYAVQTFLQLLPATVEDHRLSHNSIGLPSLRIEDHPRFEWRGLMLDVSRHFFKKDMVMRYIDQMAKYKFNRLHLHLTDDHGWRFEVKQLPELTNVGAWRVERVGYWSGFEPPQQGEEADYGGYYTEEDIDEIVQYAEKKFVQVIPEIDIPAHSLALIASYPNLSCSQLPVYVNPGIPWTDQLENVLCAGNEEVFDVLDKIFSEVARVFPAGYIHLGGDEAVKKFWERCPKCQQRMKNHGLKSLEELQSYFVKRVDSIIQSKGKKTIGWDEINEGGLPQEAIVMGWRGMDGGMEAASNGHKVIMSPWQHAYLDLYQGDPIMENGPGAVCRLSSCYSFEPVPVGINDTLILGGQGNLWTEYVPNERYAQYMTWPRAMALAEVFWSDKSSRDFDEFIGRLEDHLDRLDAVKINYSTKFYEPMISSVEDDGKLKVVIETEVAGLEIYYTFDDTPPDSFYPKYNGQALTIPKGAHHIRAVSYKNGKQVGRTINLPLTVLKNRIKTDAL